MNKTIQNLLNGKTENHILPFFWQHGEDEKTLRQYMNVIKSANCDAVCVESRPHPDFCGPKWWQDMDCILDEAKKLNMKVWILDDSHFPTGYANGVVANADPSLCRQGIFCNTLDISGNAEKQVIDLKKKGLLDFKQKKVSFVEKALTKGRKPRQFDDDRVLSVSALNLQTNEIIDLSGFVKDGTLTWDKPSGDFKVQVCILSRNVGYHRDYINMLDKKSVQLLIDEVYEKHWDHYKEDFGKTIVGFFSDEPEFGNGYLYAQENVLGTYQDLPWSSEVEEKCKETFGDDWKIHISLLWNQGDETQTATVRYQYMDLITNLVKENFSYGLGTWCHDHGVQYIGHVIEDNGQHCRTGSSLGHYFRSLEGQDMAGIDDIGGQVYPQGEDGPNINQYRRPRHAEFYHYALAKLAQSAAAIEPRKEGRAMCEIFGNYGWSEGVHLEKYLVDHFLVRGINYFVPHAFSPKAFPDPDCPPHFYAQGHNPQIRHFGELMQYTNRIATITSSGKANVPCAILYHAEADWTEENAMPFEKPLRALYDNQLDCHVIPSDVFERPDFFRTQLGSTLFINGQQYQVLVIPACDSIQKDTLNAILALSKAGMPVYFIDKRPKTILNSDQIIPTAIQNCPIISLNSLAETVKKHELKVPTVVPASDRIRILHIQSDTNMFMIVNEDKVTYKGKITLPCIGNCFEYDAWNNSLLKVEAESLNNQTQLTLEVEPLKSKVIVFGDHDQFILNENISAHGEEIKLASWTRSTCEGSEYPNFIKSKTVTLPDNLAKEQPKFSGFVRYNTSFELNQNEELVLNIEDASEGVEVFVNDVSLGIQIVPPYIYDLSKVVQVGTNTLTIEVATTLERQCYPMLDFIHKILTTKPNSQSGITGNVTLTKKEMRTMK